jgi:uncharacterized protein (TIGR03067 family)
VIFDFDRNELRVSAESINPLGKSRVAETSVYTYRLDLAQTPKAVDLVYRDSGVAFQKGIYKVEGKRLSLCWSAPGGEKRPTAFTAEAGSGRILTVFRRADARQEDSDVTMLKERLEWSLRMAHKGYVTRAQVEADRERLAAAERAFDAYRKEPDRADEADRAKLITKVYPVAELVGRNLPEGGAPLIQVITRTIQPATWDVKGGAGSIEYFPEGRSLVISQTAAVQERVQALLEDLRKVKADQDKKK